MDAIIYNVKEVQARAYKNYAWLVRPIGIGPPLEQGSLTRPVIPSVLCHLIHCDWATYEREQLKSNYEAQDSGKDEGEPEIQNPELHVPGPDGKYVSVRVLRPKCESGCVTCGGNLKIGHLDGCVYVNEGRDILCVGCQNDIVKEATKTMLPAIMH
jgi:hypothetical protein